jgi:hypothetical protein
MAVEPMLAHSVYFKLIDHSAEARQHLVEACRKYLSGHTGTVCFAAGILADDLAWDVSDRDFDVALHLVFRNRAAHDQYQDSDRHLKFIQENEGNWKQIRAFDAYVEP